MAIILRYVHVPRSDGTLVKAPFIPVFVRDSRDKLLQVAALLDSGADNTVVPRDLATVLGLKEDEHLDTGGIGGKVKVRRSKLQITLRGSREYYMLQLPVLVMQDKSEDVPLILGRNGFFEQFDITFRQRNEQIVLKRLPTQ
ncbi:retropepsin-like domain-containing protein [Candidatus Woesearchaeota archaeon]|nr:retropepsin-like domain-containing protein [Candidatus Woesearchaeota archaeon]